MKKLLVTLFLPVYVCCVNPFSYVRNKFIAPIKTTKQETIRFAGIMCSSGKKVALIQYRGETFALGVGEVIGDVTIKKVSDRGVLVEKEGKASWIKMPVE
jgi:Tfp pilus assembly protein PilP